MGNKKLVKIGKKNLLVDEDGSTQEVDVEEEKPVEKPVEKPEAEEAPKEDLDDKVDEAAEKIVARLGLDKIQEAIRGLQDGKKEEPAKKISALLDLETLMKKDVGQMTAKEKIIGFFQGMIQSNHAVLKALSEGTAADGGYLFPDEFRSEIIRDISDGGYMRSEVTVIPMKRDILKIPTLTTGPKVTWTAENAAKSTTTAAFYEATLTVKKMAAIMYASDELVEDSTEIDVVSFIVTLFAEAIGREEDRVIWRGNGTTEPTGIVVAQAAAAIAGVTCAGNLSYENVISLMYALPAKYHKNAKFYVHRNNISEMRKLKDGNSRYYWMESVSQGMPPTLLGYPVVEVNDLGEDQIYFGDLKKTYWFGDRKKMTVKISQDTETAFVHDQTAIRVVERIAGNVVLGAACKALITIP
jgi:HK97 family phage major capsid protein